MTRANGWESTGAFHIISPFEASIAYALPRMSPKKAASLVEPGFSQGVVVAVDMGVAAGLFGAVEEMDAADESLQGRARQIG